MSSDHSSAFQVKQLDSSAKDASAPVIRVTEVTKTYRLWKSPRAFVETMALHVLGALVPPLRSKCANRREGLSRGFDALKGFNLQIRRGEAIGVVGRNGSGKSTLLQVITGTLEPTAGEVEVNGRVAALLELGSGFNPEFTGRENVILNASILGLTKEQIRERFDSIVAFAEIDDFIDRPIKTYSSGMVVKLAFSVIAHVDADILIIDEALAVGDARFQLKCARVLDRFLRNKGTLLFVSHDMGAVKRLCSRAVLLDHGVVLYSGKPNDVANLYTKLLADGGSAGSLRADIEKIRSRETQGTGSEGGAAGEKNAAATENGNDNGTASTGADKAPEAMLAERLRALEAVLWNHPQKDDLARKVETLLADERGQNRVSGHEFAYGGEAGRIVSLTIAPTDGGRARDWFTTGENVVVKMVVASDESLDDPIYALTVKNTSGVEVYGTNTLFSGQAAPRLFAGNPVEVTFSFALNLAPGAYFLSFGFTRFAGDNLVVLHRRYDALKIDVHGVDRSFGIANLHARIAVRDAQ